jgi:hypothetical protein
LTSHAPPPLPELPKKIVAPTQTIHIPAAPTPGEVIGPKGQEASPILPSDPLPAPKIAPPTATPTPAPTSTPPAVLPPLPTPAPMVTLPPIPAPKQK